jgi:3-hydroxymyristoyl/3-hydroxydecanoyl-(acyl carrier protein) dehydratase
MQQELHDVISADHAALPGHFPGHPVVPAVVILNRVRKALATWQKALSITRISRAKFVAVLSPDENFKITLSSADLKKFSFVCRKENGVQFAHGEFLAGLKENA